MTEPLRVNFGCGKHPVEGWVNVDGQKGPGVDVVMDLETANLASHFVREGISQSMGSHVIEHLANPLMFMQELYWATKPDGTCVLACPYGSSDDAWENPDHKRPWFVKSWGFFGQPNYWREGSYGYTADWKVEEVELRFNEEQWRLWGSRDLGIVMHAVNLYRNVVTEQVVTLRAVKPARAQDKALQTPVPVRFSVLVPENAWTNRVIRAEDYDREMREGR